jgi:uncharacterized protein YbbC (DUF1343 family)
MRPMTAILLTLAVSFSCSAGDPPVQTGADRLAGEELSLVRGKRIGLVTNHTGRCSNGEPLLDVLAGRHVAVAALFSPEHGALGKAGAGAEQADSIDPIRGTKIFSLYGAVKRPTPAMLAGIDMLVYDIQDVGVRFYTYISTMVECMNAAAAAGLPFVVLDRPDPQGGLVVDGPVLPDSLRSFVGPLPIPVVYGLTVGELAQMVNNEGWLEGGRRAELTVVWMKGWTRGMTWEETGLDWVSPSPNIRTPEAALVYPASCFLEATALSEGRGTDAPFCLCGAPFVDGRRVDARLKGAAVRFLASEPALFTPADSKHTGRPCSGVRLSVEASPERLPVEAGLVLLDAFRREAPDSIGFRPAGLARLLGDPGVIPLLEKGAPVGDISARWRGQIEKYLSIRSRILHYCPK